jgi:formyltetrahydrofolate deformylase
MAGSDEDSPHEDPPRYSARLLIGCPDRPGIVAAVSGFLFEQGANIVSSHQYSSDPTGGRFFLRTEFFLPDLLGATPRSSRARELLRERFETQVADRFAMDWELRFWGQRRRVAILVSRHDHCLVDLLWRWRRGELDADLVAVISNHPDLEPEARTAGVPYHHIPVEPDRKPQADAQMLDLLRQRDVDLLVLARYMQILSPDFLARVRAPAINIHHSFLPAFPGADPYRRAHDHGVKLIGATAHYVTPELDAGPIIEQGVERVDHRQTVPELARVGRDIERIVLARAVSLHLADRVIADGGRTVVF